MSKIRKGDKVTARVHHNGVKSGTVGKVTAVYNGVYYAVSYPGVAGVCYTPDAHALAATGAAATPTPSAPGSGTGSPSPVAPPSEASQDAAAYVAEVTGWETLIEMTYKPGAGGRLYDQEV